MTDIEPVWERIRRHAGEEFLTITGLSFVYEVPGNYLRTNRTVRHLSKTNFARALADMPAPGPGAIPERQGASYTWAILMDERIRSGEWWLERTPSEHSGLSGGIARPLRTDA
ncbi:hypothetical protein [Kribbella lupini]